MRTALIKAFGEPTEVLELADVPKPSGPAAGEVLVGDGADRHEARSRRLYRSHSARREACRAAIPAAHQISASTQPEWRESLGARTVANTPRACRPAVLRPRQHKKSWQGGDNDE